MRRPAGHEQEDHPLGLGGILRQAHRQRIAGSFARRGQVIGNDILRQQTRQAQHAKSVGKALEGLTTTWEG